MKNLFLVSILVFSLLTSVVNASNPCSNDCVIQKLNKLAPVVGSRIGGSIVAGTIATGCPATILIPSSGGIVSTAFASVITNFDTATNETDGRPNTSIIATTLTNNGRTGAALSCQNLLADGARNWYLPSIRELTCIMNNWNIWSQTQSGNFSPRINEGNDVYIWTSTHINGTANDNAPIFFFEDVGTQLTYNETVQTQANNFTYALCVRRP